MNLKKAIINLINLSTSILKVKLKIKKINRIIKLFILKKHRRMYLNSIIKNKKKIKYKTFILKRFFSRDFLLFNLNLKKATKWKNKF